MDEDHLLHYEIVDAAGQRSPGGSVADLRRLLPTRRRMLDDAPAFTLVAETGASLAVGADRVVLTSRSGDERTLEGVGDDRVAALWLDVLRSEPPDPKEQPS